MDDALMRAAVWNAVRDSVGNALLHPQAALDLMEVSLPHETQDLGVSALGRFAVETVAGRLLGGSPAALAAVNRAAGARLADAEPGSGVQLSALRLAIASSADDAQLRGWLDGAVPEGTEVDLDLRWRLLVRLATLGAVGRDELQQWFARETTAEAKVHLARCLASLPDAEAKSYAWDRFTGAVEASNYELEAVALGMWQPGQEEVTAPYVDRYFAEVAGTASIRSGWTLAEGARGFYPTLSLRQSTVDAAEEVLADVDLDPSLRRVLVDSTDDLRRGLRVRRTFRL
jgi:aminopeptidase N